MITVLVICGSGVAMSSLASQKLKEICEEENIKIKTYQCKSGEAKAKTKMIDPDIIITTVGLTEEFNIPIIDGKPLITEKGMAEFKKDLFSVIVKLSSFN